MSACLLNQEIFLYIFICGVENLLESAHMLSRNLILESVCWTAITTRQTLRSLNESPQPINSKLRSLNVFIFAIASIIQTRKQSFLFIFFFLFCMYIYIYKQSTYTLDDNHKFKSTICSSHFLSYINKFELLSIKIKKLYNYNQKYYYKIFQIHAQINCRKFMIYNYIFIHLT